jgi:hypothetical protein
MAARTAYRDVNDGHLGILYDAHARENQPLFQNNSIITAIDGAKKLPCDGL